MQTGWRQSRARQNVNAVEPKCWAASTLAPVDSCAGTMLFRRAFDELTETSPGHATSKAMAMTGQQNQESITLLRAWGSLTLNEAQDCTNQGVCSWS